MKLNRPQEGEGDVIRVYIDFEMNMDNSKNKRDLLEADIIAIGAIKYNTSDNKIEEFKSLIKPISTNYIYPHIIELTHINQDDIDRAPRYEEVMRNFKKWLGDYSRIEGIYTFGNLDYTCFNNTDKKSSQKYNHPRFINNIKELFIDIKDKYIDYGIRCVNYISLKNLLILANVEFEGEAHDPLFDAYNLFILDEKLEKDIELRNLFIIKDFIKLPFTNLNDQLEAKFELYQNNFHNNIYDYREDEISIEILNTIRKYILSIRDMDIYNIESLRDVSKKLSIIDNIRKIEDGYFYIINNLYLDIEDLLLDLNLYKVSPEEYKGEIDKIIELFEQDMEYENINIEEVYQKSC